MKYFGADLGEKHSELSKLIRRKDSADRARQLSTGKSFYRS